MRIGYMNLGLAAAAMLAAPAISMEPRADHTPAPATIRTRHKPSGSQPVPGGGAKERAKRLARIEACDHDYQDRGNHYACKFCGHSIAGLPEADAARNAAITS